MPARIYSKRLLGLENKDCTIPKCPCTMTSTGWLEHHELGASGLWCIEFDCPDHGQQLTAGGRWQRLIDEVLRENDL